MAFHWNQGQLIPAEEPTLDLQQQQLRSNKQAGEKNLLFHCLNRIMSSVLSTGWSINPWRFRLSRILYPRLKNGNTHKQKAGTGSFGFLKPVEAGDAFPRRAPLCPALMSWQDQPTSPSFQHYLAPACSSVPLQETLAKTPWEGAGAHTASVIWERRFGQDSFKKIPNT